MSNTKHVRSRHFKSNPADFILSTDDFQSNEKDHDVRLNTRNKHYPTQVIFMIFTAMVYLFHTLRAYVPVSNSQLWSNLAIRPITRVYSSDLRPTTVTENLLFLLTANWQTLSLLYILSYIPRRTNLGYIYRNLNIFNSFLCFLLINALVFQAISQSSSSSEVSCVCLYVSLILLAIICRIAAVKSYSAKNENRYKSTGLSIDLYILRYFVLNSLFLYATSIAYLAMCATIEYIGLRLDPNVVLPKTTSVCTTIGLLMMFLLLLIYFLLDRLVYEQEFWPVWTPYLFIAYVFICPPLRQLSFLENETISNQYNHYLLWALFSFVLLIIFMRLCRQLSLTCRQGKKKVRISSHIEQVTCGTETD